MNKKWQAKWITDPLFLTRMPLNVLHKELDGAAKTEHDPTLRNHHLLVRKTFDLKNVNNRYSLEITADDYYKLYINGKYAGQGPAQSYYFRYYYNKYDLSKFLVPGKNTIAVHVFYQGMINRAYNSADYRQGMIAELLDEVGNVMIGTDETWKMKQTMAYGDSTATSATGHHTQFIEQIDARQQIKGWHLPQYDDAGWKNASVKTDVDYQFVLQPTPVVDVYRQAPAIVQQRGENQYWIDFGQEITGSFTMRAKGRPGEQITIMYGEELWESGHVREKLRCDCNYKDTWTLSGEVDELEPFDYKGFRYVEVHATEAVVFPESFAAIVRHYPFPEEASHFSSDHKKLQQIWQLCANTVRYATQEHFVDCPTREKGQYLGDNTVTAMSHLYLTGDLAMYRKALEDFAASTAICPGMMAVAPGHFMQEIADYSLQFPQQVLTYYHHSGDIAFLRSMQPITDGIARYFSKYQRDDGLLEHVADKWNLVDWPVNMRDEYDFPLDKPVGEGCHNVMNAFYYGALCACDEIRRIVGMDPLGGKEEFLAAFQQVFWREKDGLFADAETSSHYSLHGNTLPLLFGMVPDGADGKVAAFLKKKKLACGVYFSYFYLKALARAGEHAFVYSLILSEEPHTLKGPRGPVTIRGYWNQMLEEGATTCFESWSKELKWNTSLCHPWASAPIPIFIEDILRLRPAKPGWKEVSFDPPEGIKFPDFNLQFKTVNGTISVTCHNGKLDFTAGRQ